MRRRDLLKAGAGAAVLGEGLLQLIHVVDGNDSDVFKANQLLIDAMDHAEDGIVNLDAYTVFTNFPVEVQHVPQEHFESGLLFVSSDEMNDDDTEALADQLRKSECVVGPEPIVTNFPILVRHVNEAMIGVGF